MCEFYKNYVGLLKRKLVDFLFFSFIYLLCPTSKSLWNLLVKLTFCRKPKDPQDAIKSLLETGESNFFLGEIPINTYPTRDPFGSTWPDHFSKADDGPAVLSALLVIISANHYKFGTVWVRDKPYTRLPVNPTN